MRILRKLDTNGKWKPELRCPWILFLHYVKQYFTTYFECLSESSRILSLRNHFIKSGQLDWNALYRWVYIGDCNHFDRFLHFFIYFYTNQRSTAGNPLWDHCWLFFLNCSNRHFACDHFHHPEFDKIAYQNTDIKVIYKAASMAGMNGKK